MYHVQKVGSTNGLLRRIVIVEYTTLSKACEKRSKNTMGSVGLDLASKILPAFT